MRAALNEAAQPQVIGEAGAYSDENGNIGWRNNSELYNLVSGEGLRWEVPVSPSVYRSGQRPLS